ncbi:MAG: nickel pincer cofactor biosynthesis protein LarC [Planctomycetes bacterium]|nr:nickel pincer cofactor biosynthesis protein LarC [Planctomycetota bacterium]
MRAIYFDCFSGISGDMILGTLFDLGLDIKQLLQKLDFIGSKEFKLQVTTVSRAGITARKANVIIKENHATPVCLPEIRKKIAKSRLSPRTQAISIRIFDRIAKAEAKIHNLPQEKVHFHELGAVDAMVDVCGAVAGMEILGVEKVYVSEIPVSKGKIVFSHGTFPIPAPATLELLEGFELVNSDARFELVTPTGAAILTTLAETRNPAFPEMKLIRTGYGAGLLDPKGHPNVLRGIMGETTGKEGTADKVWLMETNLDDATGEEIGYLAGELFNAGALDAWTEHIYMKKNRPAFKVSALARHENAAKVEECFFLKSTTLGIRKTLVERVKLERKIERVDVSGKKMRLKTGEYVTRNGRKSKKSKLEYDDWAH